VIRNGTEIGIIITSKETAPQQAIKGIFYWNHTKVADGYDLFNRLQK